MGKKTPGNSWIHGLTSLQGFIHCLRSEGFMDQLLGTRHTGNPLHPRGPSLRFPQQTPSLQTWFKSGMMLLKMGTGAAVGFAETSEAHVRCGE